MVEIFKTNVLIKTEAKHIINILSNQFNNHLINFDLEDCDKILRVENRNGCIESSLIENILYEEGFSCEQLTD